MRKRREKAARHQARRNEAIAERIMRDEVREYSRRVQGQGGNDSDEQFECTDV